ncbi:MAG: hypothetical protein ACRDZ2_16480 [Ilumatobacteraceae bacterium]
MADRGDPVLSVHARPFAGWYAPLLAELDDHHDRVPAAGRE